MALFGEDIIEPLEADQVIYLFENFGAEGLQVAHGFSLEILEEAILGNDHLDERNVGILGKADREIGILNGLLPIEQLFALHVQLEELTQLLIEFVHLSNLQQQNEIKHLFPRQALDLIRHASKLLEGDFIAVLVVVDHVHIILEFFFDLLLLLLDKLIFFEFLLLCEHLDLHRGVILFNGMIAHLTPCRRNICDSLCL